MPPSLPCGPSVPAAGRSSSRPGRPRLRHLFTLVAALATAGTTLYVTSGAATAASPTAALSPRYVALGDSFTSGPGIASQLGPDTNPTAPAACQRSSGDYPTIVARDLGLALSDASCLGATTDDLTGSQGSGIPAQLSALGSSTSVVSLGIGGNDLGFSSIIADCAAATPWGATKVGWNCTSHYTAGGIDQLADAVHKVGARVATALAEIRSRAPSARVFLIGYPDIFPPDGAGCWPKLPFSSHDLGYLRNVEDALNQTLAGDAAGAGDQFVDMATPSATHSACTSDDTRWVEPIVPLRGGFPLHPSAVGMAGMARVLDGAITADQLR